eukprot:12915862-Prorocentrum_lima.AAC.1
MADRKWQFHFGIAKYPIDRWMHHYSGVSQVGGHYSGVSQVVTHPQKRAVKKASLLGGNRQRCGED